MPNNMLGAFGHIAYLFTTIIMIIKLLNTYCVPSTTLKSFILLHFFLIKSTPLIYEEGTMVIFIYSDGNVLLACIIFSFKIGKPRTEVIF